MFTEKALNIKHTPADEEEMFGIDNNKKNLVRCIYYWSF